MYPSSFSVKTVIYRGFIVTGRSVFSPKYWALLSASQIVDCMFWPQEAGIDQLQRKSGFADVQAATTVLTSTLSDIAKMDIEMEKRLMLCSGKGDVDLESRHLPKAASTTRGTTFVGTRFEAEHRLQTHLKHSQCSLCLQLPRET
jgi:hypothetical protein